MHNKRDKFNVEIVNFPFLDGDVPQPPYCGVYISQLIRLQQYVLMLATSATETIF